MSRWRIALAVVAGVLFLGYVLVLVGAWAIGGGW
jgi:hypothetical protein